MPCLDSFGSRTPAGAHTIYRLDRLVSAGVARDLERLPYSIRILLEMLLRHEDGRLVTDEDIAGLAGWRASSAGGGELAFLPARVIMQDFAGMPCLVDLAAMRTALRRMGRDPRQINPQAPADLVIDHSLMVDFFGSPEAAEKNLDLEYSRNRERYEFMLWAGQAFDNLRVVPPATGIIHQVNLEYLAQGVIDRAGEVYPDTVVGTDSHTPMVNSLGVLGWGVGGIEALAVLLGQPLYIVTPQVTGVRMHGALRPGVTATDLVLAVAQVLRRRGVVDKIVEFTGPGLDRLPLPDRATIANMAPDYGATAAFFPPDGETLRYLRQTGRGRQADLAAWYWQEQGLLRTAATPEPEFSDVLDLDLDSIEPCVAGPRKPEERIPLPALPVAFMDLLRRPAAQGGYGLTAEAAAIRIPLSAGAPGASAPLETAEIGHGAVALAAITSCTNTSNPALMIGAGLLAKKAVERGLSVPPWVKTVLAPGSQVVTRYLDRAGLTPYLEQLGFYLAGYGCLVCVGNSGPLPDATSRAIRAGNLVAAAVLSGNRNFEGRIHPEIRANFLASPPLVVAFALAGRMDIDLDHQPLVRDGEGRPVYLRDLWPPESEIAAAMAAAVDPDMFVQAYADVFDGGPRWKAISVRGSDEFEWDPDSSYLVEPPFFQNLAAKPPRLADVRGARALALFGDGVTTDHISPVGNIAPGSPAARYLSEHGVSPEDFNAYGTRRGNHEVMMRGAFANIRLKNLLLGGEEGPYTRCLPGGEKMTVYDAAMRYRDEGTPLIVIAGKEYGTGSARDWAAKATALIGVRAVLAASFERIHRGNLVGMGVLPVQFAAGQNAGVLGLTGEESYEVLGISDRMRPGQVLEVVATSGSGANASRITFLAIARLDTQADVDYYRHGGITPMVMRELMGPQPV